VLRVSRVLRVANELSVELVLFASSVASFLKFIPPSVAEVISVYLFVLPGQNSRKYMLVASKHATQNFSFHL